MRINPYSYTLCKPTSLRSFARVDLPYKTTKHQKQYYYLDLQFKGRCIDYRYGTKVNKTIQIASSDYEPSEIAAKKCDFHCSDYNHSECL
jgi:hypothetical protein